MAADAPSVKASRRIRLTSVSRFKNSELYPSLSSSFGRWEYKPDSIPEHSSDKLHKVQLADEFRLDLISYQHYRTPYLWWAIALANTINDPFTAPVVDDLIRVPSLSRVKRLLL